MSALPVQDLFDALHDAGLSVLLAPSGGLVVSPGSRITPHLRELVKGNKAALVDWLQASNDPAVPELERQQSAEPPDLVQPPTPAPDKPAKPPKQTFMDWQDTWLHLDRAYQAHHFNCSTCKAAGLGYGLRCGTGAALWTSYSSASS